MNTNRLLFVSVPLWLCLNFGTIWAMSNGWTIGSPFGLLGLLTFTPLVFAAIVLHRKIRYQNTCSASAIGFVILAAVMSAMFTGSLGWMAAHNI